MVTKASDFIDPPRTGDWDIELVQLTFRDELKYEL